MKILISIGSLGLGGAEKQAVWLANEFSKANEVTLVTYYGGKREDELASQVKWVRLVHRESQQREEGYFKTTIENHSGNFYSNAKSVFSYGFFKLSYFFNQRISDFKTFLKNRFEVLSFILEFLNKIMNLVQSLITFAKIYQTISKAKPEFVITFLYHDTLTIGLASVLRLRKPILIVGRRSPFGYCDDNRGWIENLGVRFVYKNANSAVSNSSANIRQAVSDGVDPKKISSIYNYVESNETRFLKSTSDRLSLICIANFFDYKNHTSLIEALKNLTDQVEITFLGEGPLKSDIIARAKELNIRAKFIGHVEQIEKKQYEIDFLILPSLFEGSSNALLETLAGGFPGITTPVGAANDLKAMGAPLIITTGFTPIDLEDAIKIALEEKDTYIKEAKNFKEMAVSSHSRETIFGQWFSLLQVLEFSSKGKRTQ